MAKISVDVPDTILEESKLAELKSAKAKVTRQEVKIRELTAEISQLKSILNQIYPIVEAVRNTWSDDLYWKE